MTKMAVFGVIFFYKTDKGFRQNNMFMCLSRFTIILKALISGTGLNLCF